MSACVPGITEGGGAVPGTAVDHKADIHVRAYLGWCALHTYAYTSISIYILLT